MNENVIKHKSGVVPEVLATGGSTGDTYPLMQVFTVVCVGVCMGVATSVSHKQ